jgi:hypothetical protein
VLYVNSIEDPWLGVSVLPQSKPESLWYLDKLGGSKFIEQGLDGPFSPESGASSLIVQCQNCAHCSDTMRPKPDKDPQGMKESRERILNWVHKFVLDL